MLHRCGAQRRRVRTPHGIGRAVLPWTGQCEYTVQRVLQQPSCVDSALAARRQRSGHPTGTMVGAIRIQCISTGASMYSTVQAASARAVSGNADVSVRGGTSAVGSSGVSPATPITRNSSLVSVPARGCDTRVGMSSRRATRVGVTRCIQREGLDSKPHKHVAWVKKKKKNGLRQRRNCSRCNSKHMGCRQTMAHDRPTTYERCANIKM